MAGFALAEGVESQNTVGYAQVDLPAGQQYVMVGLPFNSITNASGSMTLDEIFPDAVHNGFKGGTAGGSADRLEFWNGNGYTSLYLYDNPTGTSSTAKRNQGHWINPGTLPDASWGTRGQPTQHKIAPGEAFWIVRYSYATATNVTFAGQVVTAVGGSKTRTLTTGYNLIAGSFSAPFVPNPDKATKDDGVTPYGEKINWLAKGCKGGTAGGSADRLEFWNGNGYTSLYLYNNPTGTSSTALRNQGYWINPGTLPDASWGTRGQPSTVKFPAGTGFWYIRQASEGELTISIDQPYTL